MDRERAARPSEKNLTDKELERIAEKIRKDGFAASIGRMNNDFAAIAAPLLKPSGAISATLTLLGSTDYVVGARRESYCKLIAETCVEIGKRTAMTSG